MFAGEFQRTASGSRYVLHRGDIRGPFTVDQLFAMRKKGSLDRFTKVSIDRAVWENLDLHLSAIEAAAAAPAPVMPPPFVGLDGRVPGAQRLDPAQLEVFNPISIRTLPVVALILLHYLTGGLFSFFWITSAHGRLPKMKSDDPSGFKAVAMCFAPFLQIYWLYVVYARLTHRVNAVSAQHRLPPIVPVTLSYIMSTLVVIPLLMFTTGLVATRRDLLRADAKG